MGLDTRRQRKEKNSTPKTRENAAHRPRRAEKRRTPTIDRQSAGLQKEEKMFKTRYQNEEENIRTK